MYGTLTRICTEMTIRSFLFSRGREGVGGIFYMPYEGILIMKESDFPSLTLPSSR